jgi:hypothetical protein
MSPISLEVLAKRHPEYRRTLERLNTWLGSHAGQASIDPKSLARDLPDIERPELAAVLMLLVKAGWLSRVYKVLTPSGVLAEGEFEDPTKIPEKLADRFNRYFDTSDSDVVPLFKRVA